MSNQHRPSKTDRTRIRRAIKKALADRKNRNGASKAAMAYVAARVGAAK
jgi:hypothetical protein